MVTLENRGEIVALNVSEAEYLERYAADFYEWVEGVVIKMSPVALRHDDLTIYLRMLLQAYFALRLIGRVVAAPFVMRLEKSAREPDLQIILKDNPGELTATAMIGAADICIEIISPESVIRDYGDKFAEYEKAGVREYWIIDPIRSVCHFYRLNATNIYEHHLAGADGQYQSPLLPGLVIHVPTLWQDPLPDFFAIGQAVQSMMKED